MEHNEFRIRKQDSGETFNILYSNSRERSCDFGTAEKRLHRIQIIALFRQRTLVEIDEDSNRCMLYSKVRLFEIM